MNQSEFDAMYKASKPPRFREMLDMPQSEARGERAHQLAAEGYLVDVPIDVWGWDPYNIMGLRLSAGYTWVPSALQSPIILGPGLSFPGLPTYDAAHPPLGSIKVSLDPKDYPPFDPPTPPTPPPSMDLIGLHAYGNVYYPGPGAHPDTVKDGQNVQQGGANFTAHVNQGLIGWQCYFTKD